MRKSRKAMLAGVAATSAGVGYMAGKKRIENSKGPARKLMDKLSDYVD
jgi:hypothetical protein